MFAKTFVSACLAIAVLSLEIKSADGAGAVDVVDDSVQTATALS